MLGTAQFGFDYGIANVKGQVSRDEVFCILNYAWDNGLRMLDTASAYGASEEVIGEFIKDSGCAFQCVSKVPNLEEFGFNSLSDCIETSLRRLHVNKLYCCLFHEFEDLKNSPELVEEMKKAKEEGLIEKIGVSLYSCQEYRYLMDQDMSFDIYQVSYNPLDQRFKDVIHEMKKRGAEVHSRSVFYKGLLFLPRDRLIERYLPAKARVQKLQEIVNSLDIPLSITCLLFALNHPGIDKIIIGVDSLSHLQQNLKVNDFRARGQGAITDFSSLQMEDEQTIMSMYGF